MFNWLIKECDQAAKQTVKISTNTTNTTNTGIHICILEHASQADRPVLGPQRTGPQQVPSQLPLVNVTPNTKKNLVVFGLVLVGGVK